MPNQQCQGLKEILSSEHYETPLLSYHHHYIIKTPAAPRVLIIIRHKGHQLSQLVSSFAGLYITFNNWFV